MFLFYVLIGGNMFMKLYEVCPDCNAKMIKITQKKLIKYECPKCGYSEIDYGGSRGVR